MAGSDVETAIEFFFEMGGEVGGSADLRNPSPPPPPVPPPPLPPAKPSGGGRSVGPPIASNHAANSSHVASSSNSGRKNNNRIQGPLENDILSEIEKLSLNKERLHDNFDEFEDDYDVRKPDSAKKQVLLKGSSVVIIYFDINVCSFFFFDKHDGYYR